MHNITTKNKILTVEDHCSCKISSVNNDKGAVFIILLLHQ